MSRFRIILVHSDPSFSSSSRDGEELSEARSGLLPSILNNSPFKFFTEEAPVASLSVRIHYGPWVVRTSDQEETRWMVMLRLWIRKV